MATAEELLAGASTGDDTTLVIDNYLRTIKIPKTITNLGVEHDDEVLTLNFKMPRYLDTTDLSVFSIRINYINANGDSDVYTVNDNNKTITDDYIKFSWLVGPTATAYKGSTKFNVCMKTMKTVDDKQVIAKEYNTTITGLPVLEGLEVDDSIITQYSDILEQWRQELFGIGDTEEGNIRATSQKEQRAIVEKGAEVLATIPEVYQETAEAAQEGIRTKADAIKSTVEGTIMTVSDSSDDYLRSLRIFGKTEQVTTTGKNLLDVQENITLSNVKGIPVNITAGRYIVSLKSETHSGNQSPHVRFYDNNVWIMLKNGLSQTVELTTSETNIYIYTYGMSASESVGVTATLEQLMVSVDGGEYEPYSGGFASPTLEWPQEMSSTGSSGDIKLWVTGKNMLRDVLFPKTHTASGIKSDYEGNGIFHVHGTFSSTSNAYQLSTSDMYLPIDPESKYTFSVKLLSGTPPDNFHPYVGAGSKTTDVKNWLAVKVDPSMKVGEIRTNTALGGSTLKDATTIRRFWIYSWNPELTAYTVDFRIQVWLEKNDVSTDYESYTEQTIALTESNILNGVPVSSNGNYTDEAGQQWVHDEIDFERGVRIERTIRTTISNFEREDGPYGSRYIASWPDVTPHKDYVECLCSILPFSTRVGAGTSWTVNGIRVSPTHQGGTFVAKYNDEVINDLDIIYIRDVPVETPLTAEELEWYRNASSKYPNTTFMNNSGARMSVVYNVDTKSYIDNGIQKSITEVLEAIENGSY